MKTKLKLLLPLAFFGMSISAIAQSKFIHSHNDYANNTPFYKAFYNGFNSIEADIFLVNGTLLVSHSDKYLEQERTLKGMYLDPVLYSLRRDTLRRVCLLIDIKDDYRKTLPALVKELKPLAAYLMTPQNPNGRLKILISGNRPVPGDYKKYPASLWFDDDLIYPHTQAEWDRVGQVSLNFEKWSKWKGVGDIAEADRKKLQKTVDSVHLNTGKLVRFWGGPDVPEAWDVQIRIGADVIGTDRIEQLAGYLNKKGLKQPSTAAIPNKLNK